MIEFDKDFADHPIVTIGVYTIGNCLREGYVWIETGDGEGMEIDESKLIGCIAKLYAENF